MKIKMTVGIPAYNEEKTLESTVNTVRSAARKAKLTNFEILIINDGSSDRTAEIISQLEKKYKNVRHHENETNKGIGAAFKAISKYAQGEKVCVVPGDDILSEYTIYQCFINMSKADLVFIYFVNKELRNRHRIFLSQVFNMICTFMFDTHVNYLNGSGVYDTRLLQQLTIGSEGYFIAAEMNLKFLLKGATFCEIPAYIKPDATKSNALSLKNLLDVITSFIRVYWEIKVKRRKEFSKKPIRVLDQV